MTEEAFLRYRFEVVDRMPDSPCKQALLVAIKSRMAALEMRHQLARVEIGSNPSAGRAKPGYCAWPALLFLCILLRMSGQNSFAI